MLVILSTLFQSSHQSGEDEVSLSAMGRAYTVDFNSMQQINEDTGTARPVQRKTNPLAHLAPASGKYTTKIQSLLHYLHFCYQFILCALTCLILHTWIK